MTSTASIWSTGSSRPSWRVPKSCSFISSPSIIRRIFPSCPQTPRKPRSTTPSTSTPKEKPGTLRRTSIRSRAPERTISSRVTMVTTPGVSRTVAGRIEAMVVSALRTASAANRSSSELLCARAGTAAKAAEAAIATRWWPNVPPAPSRLRLLLCALRRTLRHHRRRTGLYRGQRLAGHLQLRLIRAQWPALPLPRHRRAHLGRSLLPRFPGLVGDLRIRLEEERLLLRGRLRPVLRCHPRVVPGVPLLLPGVRSGPPGLQRREQRRMGEQESDLLLGSGLRPGVVEGLAGEIRVLEREHLPLLGSGLLPGVLDPLDHPGAGLEKRGALLGSRGDPMMLQRTRAEQRVRPQDSPALVGSGFLPALLDRLAGLSECLEEEGLLVWRSILPARLEGGLNRIPRGGRLLWLALLRLDRLGSLLWLGLFRAGRFGSARGRRFGRLGRLRRCRWSGRFRRRGRSRAVLGGLPVELHLSGRLRRGGWIVGRGLGLRCRCGLRRLLRHRDARCAETPQDHAQDCCSLHSSSQATAVPALVAWAGPDRENAAARSQPVVKSGNVAPDPARHAGGPSGHLGAGGSYLARALPQQPVGCADRIHAAPDVRRRPAPA